MTTPTYRLAPGLVRFATADTYVVEGGPAGEAFTGPGAVDVLPQLCDLLDGHHSVRDIARLLRVPPADVVDGIALLAQRGLVQPAAVDAGTAPTPAGYFLARTVGYLGRATSGEELLSNLREGRALVTGHEPLRTTIMTGLHRGGIAVQPYAPDLLTRAPAALSTGRPSVVVVETLTGGPPTALAATLRAGQLWLGVRVDADGASVGPLLHPGLSCACQLSPEPVSTRADPPTGPVNLAVALAVGEVVHALGGGADVTTLDTVIEIRYADRLPVTTSRRLLRRLDCPDCGLGADVDPTADARACWAYEQEISVPPPTLDAWRDTRRQPDTVPLQRRGRALPTCPSLPADAVPTHDPLRTLAGVLARTVGLGTADGPDQHAAPVRVVPSAGNLGSAQAFVIARRDLPGLGSHCAWYDPAADRFVATGRIDRHEVTVALATVQPPEDWEHLVVWVGDVDRTAAKYADLALRLVHLDAGVVIAQAVLVAGAYGLVPLLLSGWDAGALAALLDLNPTHEVITGVLLFRGGGDD